MNRVNLGRRDRGHRNVLGDLLFANLHKAGDVVGVFGIRLKGEVAIEMITGSHVVRLFTTARGVKNKSQLEVGGGVCGVVRNGLLEGEDGRRKILAGETPLTADKIRIVLMADTASTRGVATRRKHDQ